MYILTLIIFKFSELENTDAFKRRYQNQSCFIKLRMLPEVTKIPISETIHEIMCLKIVFHS